MSDLEPERPKVMQNVYRWYLYASGLVWALVGLWNSAWLTPLALATGVLIVYVARHPLNEVARVVAFYLVPVVGLLQILDLTRYQHADFEAWPAFVIAGVLLIAYTDGLIGAGWVAAYASDERKVNGRAVARESEPGDTSPA